MGILFVVLFKLGIIGGISALVLIFLASLFKRD